MFVDLQFVTRMTLALVSGVTILTILGTYPWDQAFIYIFTRAAVVTQTIAVWAFAYEGCAGPNAFVRTRIASHRFARIGRGGTEAAFVGSVAAVVVAVAKAFERNAVLPALRAVEFRLRVATDATEAVFLIGPVNTVSHGVTTEAGGNTREVVTTLEMIGCTGEHATDLWAFVAAVVAVVVAVALPRHVDALARRDARELLLRAAVVAGNGPVAAGLVRPVPAVDVPVALPLAGDAAPVAAAELLVLARLRRASYFISAVVAVDVLVAVPPTADTALDFLALKFALLALSEVTVKLVIPVGTVSMPVAPPRLRNTSSALSAVEVVHAARYIHAEAFVFVAVVDAV